MLKLVRYFIEHPRVTNMIMILLVLLGLFSLATNRRENLPTMSFNTLIVTTVYPGAGPEDVEINVTNKIEEELLEVQNIRRLTSMSMENVSTIVVEIDVEAGDVDRTKTDVRDAVLRVSDLPAEVTERPVIEEVRASNLPVVEYHLSGSLPEAELRGYARELELRLKDVPGVASVTKIGYRDREVHIDVDGDRMQRLGISFAEVMWAIQARNVRATGGTLQSYVAERQIVTLSEYEELGEVGDVIVRSVFGGRSILVDDIATVSEGFEEPEILYRADGNPGIGFVITKQDNADIIDVADAINAEVAVFADTLPPELTVEPIFDYSIFPRQMLDIAVNNGIIGFILVLLVMFFFLDWRSAFWAAVAVPVAVFAGAILFPILGITLNAFTIAAIIIMLGILVDDAIVITERTFALKQKGIAMPSLSAVAEMRMPIFSAMLTTALAFLPILFIPGVMGDLLQPIALVVTVLLGAGLADAFFLLPAHVAHGKPQTKTPARMRFVDRLVDLYRKAVQVSLRFKVATLVGFVLLLLGVGLLSLSNLQFMLNQDLDPDFFAIRIEAPQGTSLQRTSDMVRPIEEMVQEMVPEEALSSFTTQVGHQDLGTLGSGGRGRHSHWAVISVYLVPAAQREANVYDIMDAIQAEMDSVREELGFTRLETSALGGIDVGMPVHVIYTSIDDEMRATFEAETIAFLEGINGVFAIESDNVPGKTEVRLLLDYPRLAQLGLTALDVAQSVRIAFDGTVLTSIRQGGEDVDFRVRLAVTGEDTITDLLGLPVANADNRLIPLRNVASLAESAGPAVINHYGGTRSVSITANIDTDVTTSAEVNAMIMDEFAQRADGTPGLRMVLAGEQEETAQAMQGFGFALIIVLVSIYFVLVIVFNSYGQPLLIMSIIPFALVGVFATLATHGLPLTFISLIGLLGLIGVVVNGTIVMISNLNGRVESDGLSREVIADGAADRFRPVIITTLTTFVGLLPTAYGVGGDIPDIRPLVLVMAWGLVFSTLVTLGFIPVIYAVFKRPAKKGAH
ncbi:MAG: efflux RND transporter permease subunit [Alkalispirochaetaceae bacterium]